MLRSLFRVSVVAMQTVPKARSLPLAALGTVHPGAYWFAKISKKEEQKASKKKEKMQAKEALGGDISEVDLNKFEEAYKQVVEQFKEQLTQLRIGRLEPSVLSNVQVKVGGSAMPLNSIGQVSAKGANVCVVSPYDSSHSELIERSLKIWDDSLDIKRQDNLLLITQTTQGKDVKVKMTQRLKKLTTDRKEELKKQRHKFNDELKKYKKIIPEDRLRTIESEAKGLFEKSVESLEKLEKGKEKELMK